MSWHAVDRFLARLRPHRQPLSLAVDGAVVAACWHVTYLFRLGFERWWTARPSYDGGVLAALVALYVSVFVIAGVPRGMWRFTGFGEVQRLALACIAAGALGAAGVQMAGLVEVPRAVLALHPVITLMGLVLVRVGYRMLYEHARGRIVGEAAPDRRALVLGAGHAARLLVSGLHLRGWFLAGLLDDDPSKQGLRLSGVPVLGPIERVADEVARRGITHLIVAMPSVAGARRRRVLQLAARCGLPVLTVPTSDELLEGAQPSRVRDIAAEDLLGREPVQLDEAGIAESLNGRVVAISGAGGSIGAELCRQVARYGPARLLLLERSEYNLYAIEQELRERHPGLSLVASLVDVVDADALAPLLATHRPQVVFHAAAYKHVPLLEDENAWAALRNNVLGTQVFASACAAAGVGRFVLVSTDKAVNPTSVMGATKRAAELVISRLAAEHARTRFMAVRFGNVLGSSGSVIPRFKEQIAKGGPVTVTHPEITRYFMTIPEAARLVVQTAALGASGRVYVLDMGESVRIADLARELIALAGRSEAEVPIVYTGLRSGEKLYEELLADRDQVLPTSNPRIFVSRLESRGESAVELVAWIRARRGAAVDEVRAQLKRAVPEYRPPTLVPASTDMPSAGAGDRLRARVLARKEQ